MSSAITVPTAAATLADTLLAEWEQHARPVRTPAYHMARNTVLTLLTDLCTPLLAAGLIQADAEDARDVLAQAAAFSIGTGAGGGPDHAARLVATALAALPQHRLGPRRVGPAQYALLSLISRSDLPLAMEELDCIIGALQVGLGEEMQLVFGHDETDDAAVPELRLWLLVGYAASM